jgi:hypothetical protein
MPASWFFDASSSACDRARIWVVMSADVPVIAIATPPGTSEIFVTAPSTAFGQCAIFPLGATADADGDGAVLADACGESSPDADADGVGVGAGVSFFQPSDETAPTKTKPDIEMNDQWRTRASLEFESERTAAAFSGATWVTRYLQKPLGVQLPVVGGFGQSVGSDCGPPPPGYVQVFVQIWVGPSSSHVL